MTAKSTPTTPATTDQGVLMLPGQGQVFRPLGLTLTLKANAAATGGACEAIEAIFPPGSGFPPHLHRGFDEGCYVLEGQIVTAVGDRAATTPTGSFAFFPRGVIHSFHNESTAPCRLLLWFTPTYASGIEGYMTALSQLPPGPPDPDHLRAILEAYDTVLVPAPEE